MNEIFDSVKKEKPEGFSMLLDALMETAAKHEENKPATTHGMAIRAAWAHRRVDKALSTINKAVCDPDNFLGLSDYDADFIEKQKSVLEYLELMLAGIESFTAATGIGGKGET